MRYNPEVHHRRSIRLKDYDYGQAGLYFITLCVWQRECIFGFVQDGEMHLTSFGEIARDEWFRTSQLRSNIELAEFVVMPNHIHGIIAIVEPRNERSGEGTQILGKGTLRRAPTETPAETPTAPTAEAFGKPTANTIPTIVRGYKAAVTKQINLLRDCPQCPVWQRNYYEHVIRSKEDHLRIAAYIRDNPRQWEKDSLRNE